MVLDNLPYAGLFARRLDIVTEASHPRLNRVMSAMMPCEMTQ
jgi:hypothetical protein